MFRLRILRAEDVRTSYRGSDVYKSPIEIISSEIKMEIIKQQENEIYKAVLNCGIKVDKDELIKALNYDRNQYEKGYQDGVAEVIRRFKEGYTSEQM